MPHGVHSNTPCHSSLGFSNGQFRGLASQFLHTNCAPVVLSIEQPPNLGLQPTAPAEIMRRRG